MIKLIPLLFLLTGCSYFGPSDLVKEYQGYADYLGDDNIEHVVLEDATPEVINFSDGSCLVILPSEYSFDTLWEAESKCQQ